MIKFTELKTYNRHNLMEEIPLKKPYTLLIEPSNLCNFQCVSCFQSLKGENYITRNKGIMDLSLYRTIIEQLKEWDGEKLKVLKLSLYGEPFTNPYFCEMLRIAKEADVAERIETTTNASLLTEDICRELVDSEIDYIRVSIYGGNQESYTHITNSKNADINQIWNQLYNIQRFKKEKKQERPFVSAKMLDTYTNENEEFIERFSKVADEVYIDKPHNWTAAEEKSFIGSLYDDEKKKSKLSMDLKKNMSDRIVCTMPFTTLAVRCNGDVSPCCVDWNGGIILGNVKTDGLKDMWNGECLYEFRKMQLENQKEKNQSCRNCEFYKNDYYMRDNIDGFPVEKLRG